MATLQEDINIINTAVYGKEMRPAISDAITQSWNAVKAMESRVDKLRKRVDDLYGEGDVIDYDTIDIPALLVKGRVTSVEVVFNFA